MSKKTIKTNPKKVTFKWGQASKLTLMDTWSNLQRLLISLQIPLSNKEGDNSEIIVSNFIQPLHARMFPSTNSYQLALPKLHKMYQSKQKYTIIQCEANPITNFELIFPFATNLATTIMMYADSSFIFSNVTTWRIRTRHFCPSRLTRTSCNQQKSTWKIEQRMK